MLVAALSASPAVLRSPGGCRAGLWQRCRRPGGDPMQPTSVQGSGVCRGVVSRPDGEPDAQARPAAVRAQELHCSGEGTDPLLRPVKPGPRGWARPAPSSWTDRSRRSPCASTETSMAVAFACLAAFASASQMM